MIKGTVRFGLLIMLLLQSTLSWATFSESFANNVKYALLPRLLSPGFLLIIILLVVVAVVIRMRKKKE